MHLERFLSCCIPLHTSRLAIHLTPAISILKRATRTAEYFDKVFAKLKDRLRCTVGLFKIARMIGCPEKQHEQILRLVLGRKLLRIRSGWHIHKDRDRRFGYSNPGTAIVPMVRGMRRMVHIAEGRCGPVPQQLTETFATHG